MWKFTVKNKKFSQAKAQPYKIMISFFKAALPPSGQKVLLVYCQLCSCHTKHAVLGEIQERLVGNDYHLKLLV